MRLLQRFPPLAASPNHPSSAGLTSVVPPLQGAPFRSLSVTVQQAATSPTNAPAAPPPPQDPAVESAEAEARVRTFYTLFESYLPYMPLSDTLEQLARGTLSEAVLLAMSALVKRRVFRPRSRSAMFDTSVAYRVRPETPCPDPEQLADRAKALVIPQLALPSLDTVYALVLLAYHEHGADRDSGLWAYCGMAIRMCIDLGLHKPFETDDLPESNLRSRIFWSVTCLDRILSCGTGRATTIPLSQIEVGLPPPRHIRTNQGVELPDPFPTLCRLLLILGNVSDAVNTTPSYAAVPPRVPTAVQRQLADYQATLPPSLQFSIQTFGAYANAGYAPIFLLLSTWHQAVHLAIHHAPLLYMQPGTPMHDLTPLSGSPAVSIADMLAYSSVIADDAFLCTPVLSQPILMAGRAATVLLRTLSATMPSTQLEPLERAVTVCQRTLERIQQRWRGLAWHVESMCKTAREVDLSGVGATIVMTDRGMFAKARLDDLARSCGWLLNELTAPADGEGEFRSLLSGSAAGADYLSASCSLQHRRLVVGCDAASNDCRTASVDRRGPPFRARVSAALERPVGRLGRVCAGLERVPGDRLDCVAAERERYRRVVGVSFSLSRPSTRSRATEPRARRCSRCLRDAFYEVYNRRGKMRHGGCEGA